MSYSKIIRPKSLIMIIAYCICGIIVGFSILSIFIIAIMGEMDWYSILGGISAIIIFLGGVILFRVFLMRRIIIDEKSIFVAKDKGRKIFSSIQDNLTIAFQDISDLFLVINSNDSNNRPVAGVFTPMLYLVICCKNGEQESINLYYYSKKQRNDLLDLIILNAHSFGNLLGYKSSQDIWNKSGQN